MIHRDKQSKKKPLLDKEEGFEYEDNIPEGFEIDAKSVVNLLLNYMGENALKSAVIYTRVSTERQAEKDLSLPTQLEICRRYASQNGYVVLKEFQDAGESARSSDRPSFLGMIDYCLTNYRAHEIKAVICFDISRFARNRYDALLFKKQLAKKGVRVHFATQNLSDGPEGELLEAFLEATDEFYSKNLARNIIRAWKKMPDVDTSMARNLLLGIKLSRSQTQRGILKGDSKWLNMRLR